MALTKAHNRMIEGAAVNVKDFGAVGDGVTDDTAAIQAAFNKLLNSEYTAISFGGLVCGITDQISITLNKSVSIISNNGGLKAIGSSFSSGERMLNIVSAGFDVFINGLQIDCNDNVFAGLRITNTTGFSGLITIQNSEFKNSRRELARDGQGSNYLVNIRGGFELVSIESNIFKNSFREAGVGVSGVSGTEAISVVNDTSTGTNYYAKSFVHTGNYYSNIDCGDTNSNRVDCDAVKYFNGEALEASANTDIFPTHFNSSGNRYVDSAGRAIKVQASHALINNETVIRENVYSIYGAFSDINCQLGSGIISQCEFIYKEIGGISGENPFTYNGASGVNGAPISTYSSTPKTGRNFGPTIISDCVIYNLVPTSTGSILSLADASTGSTVPSPINISLSNVKMVGGSCGGILIVTPIDAYTQQQDVSIIGTSATEVLYGLVGLAGSSTSNYINVSAFGNSQYSGTDVFGLYNNADGTEAKGFVSGSNNNGYVETSGRIATGSGEKSPIAFRANSIYPIGPKDSPQGLGGINVDSTNIANGATYTFRKAGYFNFGLYFISVAFGRTTQVVFGMDAGGVVDMSGGAASSFAFGSGSDPGISGKINVWHDGTNLKIRNDLGSARQFTIMCFG